ncbi:hypothetical protein STREPTOSP366_68800 [Streptomyces variabilis]
MSSMKHVMRRFLGLDHLTVETPHEGSAGELPEARRGGRCPACGRGRVLSEDGSSGGVYLYCPARGCAWTQDL